jgi:hypothetical protein
MTFTDLPDRSLTDMCYLEWLAQYNGIELESRQNAFL